VKKNSWLASASKGATHQRYEIRTVTDFFKVPEDRRRICLREFHSWLAIQEGVTALLTAAGDSMETPIPPDAIHWHNEVFTWIDDGKATIGVQMVDRKTSGN
jgi:hypothetical protein